MVPWRSTERLRLCCCGGRGGGAGGSSRPVTSGGLDAGTGINSPVTVPGTN